MIIPIYNAEKTLVKCINSVLSQTYEDLQILLINDGSSDKSLSILQGITDKRVEVISTRHSGISTARNFGLIKAQGEYVCFVDADDCFSNRYAIQSMASTPADLVIGGFRRDYLDKQGIRTYASAYLDKPNRNLEFAYVWGKLFKREILAKHNILFQVAMGKYEDTEFVFNYLRFSYDCLITGNKVYEHTCRNDGAGMRIFDSSPACELLLDRISQLEAPKETINHARVSLKIIEIVRAYRLSFLAHYSFIVGLVDNPLTHKSLLDYECIEGNSRLIPFLIKFRLYLLLTIVCRIRGRKRYG